MDPGLEAAPYDNVEFGPIQRGGKTGTWPGPQSQQQISSSSSSKTLGPGLSPGGLKLIGAGSSAVGNRLSPLEESSAEAFAESRDQRMQATFLTQHQQQQQQQQNASAISFSSAPGASSMTSALMSSSAAPTSASSSGLQQQQKSGLVFGTSPFPASTAAVASGTAKGTLLTTSTLAATTTATTTTTTTSSSAAKTTAAANSTSKTDNKPAPKFVTASTYVLTQVGSGGASKDSAGLRSGDDDVDFKRHDLDPASRGVLESAFTLHDEFYRLNSKVLDEGALLKQDVLDIYRKSGEAFSYEQLLQGMLEDGEMLLLGGCWLHYVHVEFKDETGEKTLRQPYGKGRLCLTNNRVLLLSADIYTDAHLEPYGDAQKPKGGGYKLEVSKQHCVVFRNLPLSCFRSADLEVHIGTSAQTKITARKAPCCGLCSCFGIACCGQRWVSTSPMTRSFNERVVRVGVELPPWGQRSMMVLHLDPGQSLTIARDFIAQLYQHSPSMR